MQSPNCSNHLQWANSTARASSKAGNPFSRHPINYKHPSNILTRCETVDKMAAHANNLRTRIPSEPDLFRRVYRYTFPLCLVQGQRNLQFEIAVEQWNLFFTPPKGGIAWNTPTTPWLDWWIEFLESRGKRPVNKDLWQQVEVFMRKTHEDEDFGWWSEDGAWPGALDDFVAYVREKRGKSDGAMEVE